MKAACIAATTLLLGACTPDFIEQNESNVLLRVVSIEATAGGEGTGGAFLNSDIVSQEGVFSDNATVTVENLLKNQNLPAAGQFNDVTIQRYQVRYTRSDGHNQEGVDVPFSISGNLTVLVPAGGTAGVGLTLVRHQAKFEPPLTNINHLGGVLTVFAEVTLFGRTTSGKAVDTRGSVQINFGNFGPEPSPPAPPPTLPTPPPPPGIDITCTPATLTVEQGCSANATCTVSSLNDFSGSVAFSCSGLPTGASCTFNPTVVTLTAGGSETTLVTVAAGLTTPVGSSGFVVQGTNGSLTDTSPIGLTVTASVPPCP